jgi:hypothetical protein
MKSFDQHIISFFDTLKPNWELPSDIELIYPFGDPYIKSLLNIFVRKFYNGKRKRTFLFGINPGRFGAGVTGIPFTDPIALKDHCEIDNKAPRKYELSSIFVYEVIDAMGGAEAFYKQFYISSLCPLGFVKDGKNYNYYDSSDLYNSVEQHMLKAIEYQISKFCNRDIAFSMGQGKNYKVFKSLNDKHQWFKEVQPLPHPRWVMQYKRKTKQVYLDEYVDKLSNIDFV